MQFEICLEALKVSAIIGILPDERTKAQDLEVDLRCVIDSANPTDNLPLGIHSADLPNFGRSQTTSLVSRPKFGKNYKSNTAKCFDCLNTDSVNRRISHEITESKKINTHPLAPSAREGESNSIESKNFPLPCGGGLRGWVETSNDSRKIIDYAILREIILATFKNNRFFYLESALVAIQSAILARFTQINTLDLSIKKLEIFSDCTPKVRLKWSKND